MIVVTYRTNEVGLLAEHGLSSSLPILITPRPATWLSMGYYPYNHHHSHLTLTLITTLIIIALVVGLLAEHGLPSSPSILITLRPSSWLSMRHHPHPGVSSSPSIVILITTLIIIAKN